MGDDIRLLPGHAERVESGAVQFGDDWPGTFIRGDASFFYAGALESLLDGNGDAIAIGCLRGLVNMLRECDLTITITDKGRAMLKGGE